MIYLTVLCCTVLCFTALCCISTECMAYLDQSSCCRPLQLLGGLGYVPDRDRDLVHPYLDCHCSCINSSGGGSGGGCSVLLGGLYAAAALVLSYACAALLCVWHLVSAVLTVIGKQAPSILFFTNTPCYLSSKYWC